MGRRKITVDELRDAVKDILNDYKDDVDECLDKAAVQYAKIGKAELQSASPVGKNTPNSGHYAKGWAYKKHKSKNRVGATIHNKTDYQLTHLLENGHALRQGGRSPAIVHIKPIHDEITEEFEREVKDELKNL